MRALRRLLLSRRGASAAMALLALLLVGGQLVPSAERERLDALRAEHPARVWIAEHFGPEGMRRSIVVEALAAYIFLATAAGMVQRVSARRAARRLAREGHLERFVARRTVVVDAPPDQAAKRVLGALRRAGLSSTLTAPALLEGARGGLSFAGSLTFHTGILVVMVGVSLTALQRFDGELLLVEGEPIELSAATMLRASPVSALNGLWGVRVSVSDVEPETTARDELMEVRALLEVQRGGRSERSLVRVNDPATLDRFQIGIYRYGFAPELRVVDRAGRVRASGLAVVRVLPAGTEDSIALEGGGELKVRFYPDFVVRDGKPASRTRLPLAPVLDYSWVEDGRTLASGRVARGASTESDGLRVEFVALRRWADFLVTADPGAPWFAVGVVLGCLGLALRFARAEQIWRAVLAPDTFGTRVELTLSSRYFPAGLENLADTVARSLEPTQPPHEPRKAAA